MESISSPINAPERAGAPVANARVESLSYDGRGVAHVGGKAVFIEGALPGEEVRFRYHHRRQRYDSAQLIEVVSASPDRVTPLCPYFGVCGGCSLQHLDPAAQIRSKQQVLADALARIGQVAPERWLTALTGAAHGYRRRARLGVRLVAERGGVLVGFRERRRSFITPLERCPVLAPRLSNLLVPLRGLISTLSCPDRVPQVELAAGDNAAAVVVRHLVDLDAADRVRLRDFAEEQGIQVYGQAGGPRTIAPIHPADPVPLSYRLAAHAVEIQFRPTDFVQINADINRQMVDQVVRLLEPAAGDQVLDLFSGLGNITLPLARRARTVLGIEGEADLVAGAHANAAHNGLTNAEFRKADLYRDLSALPWAGFDFRHLVLDPPRGGAMETLKRLAPPGPERIVYVSCFPGTLARDSGYLVRARGYRLAAAGVMDMFPHTSHVEAMALFLRS